MESPWTKIQERAFMAPPSSSNPRVMDQQMKIPNDLALKCPRCDSSNTKFCYYNNYSLTQPRHFCKACKRYWTRGGTLRNVPVGGGCRKNKRIKRTNTESLDHGVATSHLKATTETKESVLPAVSSLSLLNCTQSLSSITTTSTATTCTPLQNPVFLSPQQHVNSSLVSSLKAVLSPGVVFPPKDGSLDSSLLHEQNGFNNIISISGASSLMIPEAFPPIGHSLEGISSHISNGMMQQNQWRSSQVQPQNFFLPLDELGNCVDTQLPKINGENLRNFSVKVDDDANRSSLELDWQTSNLSRFGTNSNETSIYWNPNMGSWPDLANYGSTVASLM